MLALLLPSLLLLFDWTNAVEHPDRVLSLPGAPRHPRFPLYAGYLNATSPSSNRTARLFYVLAESIRSDPSSSPLLIWFNGGPGASSLGGCFLENGPYRVTEKGDVLEYNEYSWNQYMNILYLESPVGVGFSVSSDGRNGKNDTETAELNYRAINDFMLRVHSRYAARDFYLTGQSYAGVYVPFLAARFLRGISDGDETNANFKGFAVGNALFDMDSRLLGQAMQLINYGLLPIKHMDTVVEFWEKLRRGERLDLKEIHHKLFRYMNLLIKESYEHNTASSYNYARHCFSRREWQAYHGSELKNGLACYGVKALEAYMNRASVQTAMHATNISIGTRGWVYISDPIGRYWNWTDYQESYPEYKQIFNLTSGKPFRILFYNGDLDVVLSPFNAAYSTAKIARENGLEHLNEHPSWRFFGSFAGARTAYRSLDGNVTMDVLTVRGSGHSVPADLPAQSFQFINNFVFYGGNDTIDYSRPIAKH